MPAFESLDHYSPILVLLLGLITFAGLLGAGLRGLHVLGWRLTSPWTEAVAALLGVATLSLLAQWAGMLGLGSAALVGVWGALVLGGSLELLSRVCRASWPPHVPGNAIGRLLMGLLLAGAAMNLLVAAAPSTKIDEIYYQMIVSQRMVLDGALAFHLQPWPAAILPQMAYGIASAPLHALGLPDAPNVLSLCLSLLLTWLGARLVYQRTGSARLGLLAAAAMQAGLYPSVFHTTGGPHALGDLATATAVVALVWREDLLRSCSSSAYVAILSTCCAVAASTKLSLVPLMGLVLLSGAVAMLREHPGELARLALAAALPWIVLYLPLCVFTFWESGSPFGPALAGLFGPSVYGAAVAEEMEGTRIVGQRGIFYAITDYGMHYPPLFAVGAAGALLLSWRDPSRRGLLAALLIVQTSLIAILLPHTGRFLSGLHHALLVVGLVQLAPRIRPWLGSRMAWAAAVAVLILPWSAVQAYRTFYLGPVALGLDDLEDYRHRYIALYDDLRKLDAILPEDAVLYSRQNLPAIYFPRPVYMHREDLPEDRRAFALLGTAPIPMEEQDCTYMRLPADCRFGEPVYVNPRAHYVVYRRPGREPETTRLEVREILEPATDARP